MAKLDPRLIQSYNRLYKQWKNVHEQYWRRYGAMPYIASGKVTDMNLAQVSRMVQSKRGPVGAIDRPRKRDPKTFKSNRDLKRAIAAMKREVSPRYQKKRRAKMREGMLKAVRERIDDPELEKMLQYASDKQLMLIIETTDFVSRLYDMAYPMGGIDPTELYDPDFLNDTVQSVIDANPTPIQKAREKARKAISNTKLGKMLDKFKQNKTEREEYNSKLAEQGEEHLKRYGVREFGEGPDWYKKYL